MLADHEVMLMHDAGQDWEITWEPPHAPPEGTRHGATAICSTAENQIILVSQDGGETWVFPGGRPEGNEDCYETLFREVLEEACAEVTNASLLGFSRGECIQGYEKGLVLVRALYRATVTVLPWDQQYETTHRMLAPPEGLFDLIAYQTGTAPMFQRWINEAI